jgi:hypothetical protein
MRSKTVEADLTVVGGGIAGTHAAVAAARLGLETALVNDRPVLGGNSSSEVRVWVNGATGGAHNRYAREGGLMEEVLLENKSRNPDGNADLWDMVLQDLVQAEENLSLYLNTLVDEVETDGDRVVSVAGTQNMSETHLEFESPYFVDATGDGILALHTDAEWRQGREAADEYGELAAPEARDEKTLGSSIMFYSERADEPIEYTPPDFAHDYRDDPPEILARRTDPEDRRCMYWWIEYGGEEGLDTIHDNEEIRDELWAMVYGAWDYIKNSGAFDEDLVSHLKLDWTGKIPGKRESRRFLGEYVLTEDDLVEQRRFDDAVGHGGWSIDLHPPAGFYDDQGRGSEHWHLDGPYAIPYRSLYPEGSENLFLAGRHVSASHVAFGSLRVQMTLGTLGQAVGTAATLCAEHDLAPHDLYEDRAHRDRLQQILLREDQWIIDVPNRDDGDLAREARVDASHEQPATLREADRTVALEEDVGLHVSAADVETVSLRVGTRGEEGTVLDVDVHAESRPENYVPDELIETVSVEVTDDSGEWVDIPVSHDVADAQGVFLVLNAQPDVELYVRERELTGVVASTKRENRSHTLVEEAREFHWPPADWTPCFELESETSADLYGPESVTDGISRPYGLPRSWLTPDLEADAGSDGARFLEEPRLSLSWADSREIAAVQVTFNTVLTPWYNALTPTDEPEVPETVRDYRIECRTDGGWETVASVAGNYRRFRRHTFDPVETDELRVVVEATNGAPRAEVFEVRAYGPDQWPPLTDV